MKLDLQLFAEDLEGSDLPADTEQQELIDMDSDDYDAFEQAYYAESEDDETPAGPEIDTDEEQEQQIEEQPFKNEHNAQMAAMRRRQEEAQRIQAARDAAFAEMYKDQVNPYTGQPIRTEQDFRQYQQQYQQEQMQQAGIDPSMLQDMISNHPAVRQAQMMMQQQQKVQQQQALIGGLQAISKIDPDIKSFEELITSPNFAQIDQMCQRGYSLEDAYKLANMEKLTQRKQAAAKQQVINQAAGKRHLKATGQNGVGNNVSVPSDVMAIYQEMMPGATEEQIRKHYAKTTKE